MRLTTPEDLERKQQMMLDEYLAGVEDAQNKIRRLASCDGYPYAKSIASKLLKEYECRPPKADEEKIKWETYCQMKWVIDKLFHTIEQIASEPEPQRKQIKVGPNADKSSGNTKPKFNTRPDAAAVSRRATRRS